MLSRLLLVLGLLSLATSVPLRVESTPAIIAHRGASGTAPENTLASFKLALAQQANTLETDAHITKDGVIVLIHDPTLERTTNGSGLVATHTFAELQTLDAGSWKGSEYANERIPSLASLLELVLAETTYQPNIILDLKNDSPLVLEKIAELIKPYIEVGKIEANRFILGSWAYEQAVQCKQLLPDVQHMYITSVVPVPLFFNKWLKLGLNIVSVNFRALSLAKGFVKYGHEHDIKTYVWTLDTAQEKSEASQLDVDAIITDFPIQPSASVAAPFAEAAELQWALDACHKSLTLALSESSAALSEYSHASDISKLDACIAVRAVRCSAPTSNVCANLARSIYNQIQ